MRGSSTTLRLPERFAFRSSATSDRAVRLVIRAYDLKFWREDPGIATVTRLFPLGDRVKVEAPIDGAGLLKSQFPRRNGLLRGIEPGCRIAIEVTQVRAYPTGTARGLTPLA